MISHPINLEDIQPELEGIAVSPQILPKLQELISDCNTNPDEIRDMIRMDPALSAMILKTANSAYFNPGYHIDSIDDGIMHLGFSDVYQIVTMLTFSELFAEPLNTYGISAGDFWKRSVACAFAMERLARKYSEDPGVAYTVGLLHGIGMVFLEREIKDAPNITFNASLPEDVALAKEELEIFGINHAKVGAAMMREWGFTDEVVIPVLNQFEPAQAGKHERMACLVSICQENDQHDYQRPGKRRGYSRTGSFAHSSAASFEGRISESGRSTTSEFRKGGKPSYGKDGSSPSGRFANRRREG